MSAYDNDPRVTDLRTGAYIVTLDSGGLVDIERGMTDCGPGFLQYPRKGVTVDMPLAIFPTADEAIRSLIGDPQ